MRFLKAAAAVTGAIVGGYAGLAVLAYARYGRIPFRDRSEHDERLNRFMPAYDVYEHHTVVVNASPEVTLATARSQNLLTAPPIRAIFKTRELVMGSAPDIAVRPRGLLESTLSMGWRILEREPDREIIVGAVTRPWEANVTFRGLAAERFPAFWEPGYVKIVWTLRVDPMDRRQCRFTTETRAIATDAEAAARFRRYWALASPGIWTIRRLTLPMLKAQAEREQRRMAESRQPSSRPFRQVAG